MAVKLARGIASRRATSGRGLWRRVHFQVSNHIKIVCAVKGVDRGGWTKRMARGVMDIAVRRVSGLARSKQVIRVKLGTCKNGRLEGWVRQELVLLLLLMVVLLLLLLLLMVKMLLLLLVRHSGIITKDILLRQLGIHNGHGIGVTRRREAGGELHGDLHWRGRVPDSTTRRHKMSNLGPKGARLRGNGHQGGRLQFNGRHPA